MDFNKYEDTIFKNAMDCFQQAAPSFFGIDVEIIAPAQTELHNIDIKHVKTKLNTGTIDYQIEAFYMASYDGDETLDTLKTKLKNNEILTQYDIMRLTFVPLMSSKQDKGVKAIESIELAQTIPEGTEKLQCIAMLYAFAEKFGDAKIKEKLKEVISMTEIGRMLVEEGMEKGMEKGKADMLIDQLTMKFKKLPKEDAEKLRSLPLSNINIIALQIFNISSLEELREYF